MAAQQDPPFRGLGSPWHSSQQPVRVYKGASRKTGRLWRCSLPADNCLIRRNTACWIQIRWASVHTVDYRGSGLRAGRTMTEDSRTCLTTGWSLAYEKGGEALVSHCHQQVLRPGHTEVPLGLGSVLSKTRWWWVGLPQNPQYHSCIQQKMAVQIRLSFVISHKRQKRKHLRQGTTGSSIPPEVQLPSLQGSWGPSGRTLPTHTVPRQQRLSLLVERRKAFPEAPPRAVSSHLIGGTWSYANSWANLGGEGSALFQLSWSRWCALFLKLMDGVIIFPKTAWNPKQKSGVTKKRWIGTGEAAATIK